MTERAGAPKFVIDEKKLPRVAAVDAGVLIRALEPGHTDRYAQACRDFWTAMLKDRERRIIIPAPSLAEHLRGAVSPVPSTAQVYVVPFDGRCAEILADRLPKEVIRAEIASFKREYGEKAPGAFIKYDAMIAACAKRWEADRLISIDRHLRSLAEKLPLTCNLPDYFYGEQVHMDITPKGRIVEL